MNTEGKKEQVKKIVETAGASDAVVMSDYSGLTVSEVNELRGKLTGLGADFRVIKNTLLGIALEEAGLKNGELSGPTATLFSQSADPIESIKTLVSFLKEKGKGEVKFGFFEKSFVDAPKVLELAALPGRTALEVQFVSHLSFPLYRFANVLSGNTQRLAGILNQIAKARGGESS